MITVKIVTPAGEYKTVEDVYLINVDTTDGMRGILPRHMPIVLALEIGKLELVQENQRDLYSVNGGMLYFENDKATILTDAIEYSGDIDLERAKEAKERAEKRLREKKEDLDELRARLALRKAINRIRVKEGSHS
ncbi:MAG: F0F1 ATP synthase subunit epsilon [Erysipelotrichales bacterium]|nr:F0F1 ATP synthase subunit epsilon [Erysipelotrichales bacterium]MBQ2309604.1 F0F1 ATP synthase subunit epsilon [Erysipelotrichales bacterium]MBQ2478427.1 F0F1 ATP synthase subunit epsilon [Erysipelotrichales bacterium]